MESEPVVARIADANQQVQQQACPRNESQTGNSSDKSSAEESTSEPNKAGQLPNDGDECQKSQGWKKGFSLKRQLSKVDLKIKNTFTPSLVSSQNGVLVCFLIRALLAVLYIIKKKIIKLFLPLHSRGIFKLFHGILHSKVFSKLINLYAS